MMPYHIAICDDSQPDAAYIYDIVKRWAEAAGIAIRAEIFPSAEAFWFRFAEDKAYDILLLDIEMGRMNGVELAQDVRRESDAIQIIFITGYSDYIAAGYDVSALHYLLKPIDPHKLEQVLDRAQKHLRRDARVLHLEAFGELVRIPLYEIRYLEVLKNYVTVHAKRDYTTKRTLSSIEAELDSRFFRTGRSYLVNLDCVRRVTKTGVTLADGSVVPLSRGVYGQLNRAIIDRD